MTVRDRRLRQVAMALERHPEPRALTWTSGELRVVSLLMSNNRIQTMAEVLHISRYAVRGHLRSIFRKLGVHSQEELIADITQAGASRRTGWSPHGRTRAFRSGRERHAE